MSFNPVSHAVNEGAPSSFLKFANYASSGLVLAAPVASLFLKRAPVIAVGLYACTQLMNYQWNRVNQSSIPGFSSLKD